MGQQIVDFTLPGLFSVFSFKQLYDSRDALRTRKRTK